MPLGWKLSNCRAATFHSRLVQYQPLSTFNLSSVTQRHLSSMSLDKSGSLSLLDRLSKPSSLPTKPIFALPPKPSVPPPPPVSRYRDSSSPPPRARTDVYIASPSPPPIRSERDVYIPSPPRRDVYISSPKRRRSPSLYRRSPSPRRHRSPSPRKSRIRSVSVKRRSPSPRRSLSVSPAPADLPKTFYTHSHIREEDLKKKQEAYKEQQRIRALRRETDRQRAAEQREWVRIKVVLILARKIAKEKLLRQIINPRPSGYPQDPLPVHQCPQDPVWLPVSHQPDHLPLPVHEDFPNPFLPDLKPLPALAVSSPPPPTPLSPPLQSLHLPISFLPLVVPLLAAGLRA